LFAAIRYREQSIAVAGLGKASLPKLLLGISTVKFFDAIFAFLKIGKELVLSS
jgi:hypothetical protein